jgi:hypothetical protein
MFLNIIFHFYENDPITIGWGQAKGKMGSRWGQTFNIQLMRKGVIHKLGPGKAA